MNAAPECYEEVPETWPARIRQIKRWTQGHNQSLVHYWRPLLGRAGHLPKRVIVDGILLLGVFAVGPLLVLGWIFALLAYYLGMGLSAAILTVLAVTIFSYDG